MLFIEARSIHDELCGQGKKISEYEYIYDNHYIRFVDKDKLIKKLEKLGFSIVYEEEKSITSKTEIKSSTVLQIVAKYK